MEDAGKMNVHHPIGPRTEMHAVVIVGGGPVGLYAAARLATLGIPSLVLEQRPRLLKQGSKALCMQSDVIELLDNNGHWHRGPDRRHVPAGLGQCGCGLRLRVHR